MLRTGFITCRPKKRALAEQQNAKMAQKLLDRVHTFDGGPVPIDVTIESAMKLVADLKSNKYATLTAEDKKKADKLLGTLGTLLLQCFQTPQEAS